MWETTKHPHRPPNALQLFVKEQFELKKKNNESLTPVTERLKEIVAKWKDLPESDKKVRTITCILTCIFIAFH